MTPLSHPEPPHPAPAGHRWEVADATGWRGRTGKRCRYMSGHPLTQCGAPSVAELNRGRNRYQPPYGRVDSWWAYCPDHLYGRWIEDDRVLEWRLAEEVSTSG